MSTLKTSNVQVGQSATATNNFTLYQPTSPDGTVRLAVGNSGATTSDVMTVSNTGAVTFSGSVTATGGFVDAGLVLRAVQASNFPAVKSSSYPVNTTSGAVTVTLPAAPAAGDQINVFDYANKAATNNITISPNGGKISGGTNNLVLNTSGISVTLVYVDSTQGWEPVVYNAFQNLNGKSWTYFTSSGTYTVPAGVTSIRGYACGAGGNGAAGVTNTSGGGGGGGGGFAYGDIAVTPGQSVTVTISAGVATLAIGATTYLTGNAGGNASGTTAGTAGTASIHASVTNGGAYSGGAGGTGGASGQCGGSGGSAGSPLGAGYAGRANSAGRGAGAGIGGIGGVGFGAGGGGAGGAGSDIASGGAGGAATTSLAGAGRAWNARFTDPLLINAVSGGITVVGTYGPAASPGAGGVNGGIGGDFGGGSAGTTSVNGGTGGNGGLMGGGGTGVTSVGGNGGLGGGAGGGGFYSGAGYAGGTGGGAFVFIYA